VRGGIIFLRSACRRLLVFVNSLLYIRVGDSLGSLAYVTHSSTLLSRLPCRPLTDELDVLLLKAFAFFCLEILKLAYFLTERDAARLF